MRISEKILRALPLTCNDTANTEINVVSPIGAFAAWLVHAIATGINLTWLSSGNADALRTALHVIPEAERKPEADNLETALHSAVQWQLRQPRWPPTWPVPLGRRSGFVGHSNWRPAPLPSLSFYPGRRVLRVDRGSRL